MNRSHANVRTKQQSATSSFQDLYPAGTIHRGFGVRPKTGDILLSIGHSAPTDTDAVLVSSGTSFDLEFGVVGPIKIKSTGADHTVDAYGA